MYGQLFPESLIGSGGNQGVKNCPTGVIYKQFFRIAFRMRRNLGCQKAHYVGYLWAVFSELLSECGEIQSVKNFTMGVICGQFFSESFSECAEI